VFPHHFRRQSLPKVRTGGYQTSALLQSLSCPNHAGTVWNSVAAYSQHTWIKVIRVHLIMLTRGKKNIIDLFSASQRYSEIELLGAQYLIQLPLQYLERFIGWISIRCLNC
jgi:hypothetical protein